MGRFTGPSVRDNYRSGASGVHTCERCHRDYKFSTVRQEPGLREREDEICPYCQHVNASSMRFDYYTSELDTIS